MVTPFNLQPVSQWLSVAQECVRTFEDAGVKPNIWIVYEYNTITPALPESIDGRPADTTTGMAYRLIQHLNDPGHRAKLTVSTVSHASKTEMRATVTVSNRSPWLDLCPLVFARMRGPGSADWSLHFYVQGKDVTQ